MTVSKCNLGSFNCALTIQSDCICFNYVGYSVKIVFYRLNMRFISFDFQIELITFLA